MGQATKLGLMGVPKGLTPASAILPDPGAAVYCAPFDDDTSLCGPIVPDVDINTELPGGKFGNGVVPDDSRLTAGGFTLQWNNLSGLATNDGAIELWWNHVNSSGPPAVVNFEVTYNEASNKNRIELKWSQVVDASSFDMSLDMWDKDGVQRVTETFSSVGFAGGWKYISLNWLWNNGGGLTEVAVNRTGTTATVQMSSTGGNSFERDDINDDVTLRVFPTVDNINGRVGMDDFTIFDSRAHVGDFVVPTVPNCVCGIVGVNRALLSLGQPPHHMHRGLAG